MVSCSKQGLKIKYVKKTILKIVNFGIFEKKIYFSYSKVIQKIFFTSLTPLFTVLGIILPILKISNY